MPLLLRVRSRDEYIGHNNSRYGLIEPTQALAAVAQLRPVRQLALLKMGLSGFRVHARQAASPVRKAGADDIQRGRGRQAPHGAARHAKLKQALPAGKVPQLQAAVGAADDHLVEVRVRVRHAGWLEALLQLDRRLRSAQVGLRHQR